MSRHEIKYCISEAKAAAIIQFIKPYLHLDRYCKLQPSGVYPIVSLYLDSHNLQLCRESLEGHKNRFKLRIRSYTDDPAYPQFFEIKRRINTTIIKDRTRVMPCNVAPLISRLSLPPKNISNDGEALKQFRLYMNNINAAPVIQVRYFRQAFENGLDNRIRVTFDRTLCYNATSAPEVGLNGQGWQRYPMDGVILEIKFTGHYPIWLNQMIKCFDLRNQSLSKYARSVKKACSLGFCSPKIPERIY
ncbi:MAG: VTC domain-containing protein [Planctomycetota bacterium]|jgi:hypothetical protein